jgi:four helix bundle protein
MRNYRSLNVWREGIRLAEEVYKISGLLPGTDKDGLKSQVCKSSISIPSNIAEGCSRNREVDFKRFLETALISSFELQTQFLIVRELDLIPLDKLNRVFDLLYREQRMLNSFVEKLEADA